MEHEQRRSIFGHMDVGIEALKALKASSISSLADLDDRDTLDAALMKLQVAGESVIAVERVVNPKRKQGSKEPHYLDTQYPSSEWKGSRGIRNEISNKYATIQNEIVWDVLSRHVDLLISLMERVRDDHA